jgi:hypothetical protein
MYYGGETLKCVKDFGSFEEGVKYYCFADEGFDFWIFAPWLENTLGVNQINVSGNFREHFIVQY